MTHILGIETSCDETAASIVVDGREVRSSIIASQHELHRRYQGVVPEIASRAHVDRIMPVVDRALDQSGCTIGQIDAVAVGHRPGLIGSLMVGLSAAKAIAWSAGKPLIGVDHVRAHLYAPALGGVYAAAGQAGSGADSRDGLPCDRIAYPAVGLVVSGGHSSLYDLDSATTMRLLGQTIDDAVGEAFDKAAVVLHLGYPGGPRIDKLAQTGDPSAYDLPRSLLGNESLDFSFSGLKTALLYTVRGRPVRRGGRAVFGRSADDLSGQQRADLAASFQSAAVDVLMTKLDRAIDQLMAQGRPVRGVVVGGGVSANTLLRRRVGALGRQRGLAVSLPAMAYCLDNAAMIAGLAYHPWQAKRFSGLTLEAVAAGTG